MAISTKSSMKVGRVLASAMLIAVASTRSLAAQRGTSCSATGFPAPSLCERARLDTVRASYTLIVDGSGSMNDVWPSVRSALVDLAREIPAGDELDVRLFSSGVQSLIPATVANEASRSAWAQRFASLPTPDGSSTDLGAAARSAIESIEAAPAERLQFVFFLTDGVHQPARSSSYSGTSGPGWDDLKARGGTLVRSRPVRVVVLRLKTEADNSVLPAVFPGSVVTDAIGPAALAEWFRREIRSAAVSKLQTLVRRELERPAAEVRTEGSIRTLGDRLVTGEVQVRPGRQIVTTVLADSGSLDLPGGGSLIPSSALFSAGTKQIRVRGPVHPFWMPPGIVSARASGVVAVTTRLEPAGELELIGVAAGPRADKLEVQFDLKGGGPLAGWLYYSTAALLVILSLLGLQRLRWRAHRAVLGGRVLVHHAGENGPASESILPGGSVRDHIVVDGSGTPLMRLEARSEKGRTVIYAVPIATGLELAGKPLSRATRIRSGAQVSAPTAQISYLAH